MSKVGVRIILGGVLYMETYGTTIKGMISKDRGTTLPETAFMGERFYQPLD